MVAPRGDAVSYEWGTPVHGHPTQRTAQGFLEYSESGPYIDLTVANAKGTYGGSYGQGSVKSLRFGSGELNAIREHNCFLCSPFYVKGVSLGYVGVD